MFNPSTCYAYHHLPTNLGVDQKTLAACIYMVQKLKLACVLEVRARARERERERERGREREGGGQKDAATSATSATSASVTQEDESCDAIHTSGAAG